MLFNENLGRIAMRAVAGVVAVASLAALASCGGGTYQVSKFQPARLLVFGDESSRLEGPQGLKYSINGISQTTLQTDCSVSPIWTQLLAANYGLVFANCNPNASNATDAVDLTTVNATVDDVVNKVSAFEAGDTFNRNDLVTIWVGVHDVLSDYQANATGDSAVLKSDMDTQGRTLGNLVNRIASAGAKVVILTIPDMKYSPFAFAESQRGDFDRFKLLSDMSFAFNKGMRGTIINDGSMIGLVEVDTIVTNATNNPGGYSLIAFPNQTYGCLDTAPLPSCTSDTLRNDPSTGQEAVGNFMWADATHLGAVMQQSIGQQATNRAATNPFSD